jgi:predicted unusual protein kinase regulating ubiquinone biosynthesis (AarF/ABC1/UbiB family)
MFDFGISYCYRIYTQIKNIYKIKTHLDIIFNGFKLNESDIIQKKNFESLKQIIFSCGSLYIKCLQWYISKLKSNIVDNKNIYKINNNGNGNGNGDGNGDGNKLEHKYLSTFISYFEDIFEQCPYHDIEHTENVFTNSMFGLSLDKYVDMSTFRSIASGSIGQVYYARRLRDGLEIAIKVKHPNIDEDLQNQYELVKFIKKLQMIPYLKNRYNLHFNLDDFLLDINMQCDFNNEANNCNTFRENFKDSEDYIVFPKIIYQSNDLLISEYIKGESFDSLTNMQKYKTSLSFICFFYQMLLVDNFLHGDLHCQNWKVRNYKDNIQIIVYDCGICFQNTSIELTNDLWFALVGYNIDDIKKTVYNFIIDNSKNSIINNDNFQKEIMFFFNSVMEESVSTSILIKSIISFFKSYNLTISKFLLNISILLCVVEEFFKEHNFINKNKDKQIKNASMYEIINDSYLDIISFCDVKKCYPKVRDLFVLHIKDNYKNYKENIEKNNIKETENTEKQLFSSLSLSTLKFKKPE